MIIRCSFTRSMAITATITALCYVAVRALQGVLRGLPGIPCPPIPPLADSGFIDRHIKRFILQHFYVLRQRESLFQLLHWAQMFDYKPFLMRIYFRRHIVISGAEDLEEILLRQEANFCKRTGYNLLRAIIGNGLLPMADKQKHAEHRHILAPIFRRSNLKKLSDELMRPHALRLLGVFFELLLRVGEGGSVTIDLSEYMNHMALSVIGEAVFRGSHEQTATILEQFSIMIRFNMVNYFFPSFRTPQQREAERHVMEVINSLLGRSNDSSEGPGQRIVLDALIEELDVRFDKKDVMNHLITFLFAGHDTTRTTIKFLCVLLSRNPRVQEKLYEELETIMPIPGICPTIEELLECEYLMAVQRETMRLYPAAPLIYRDAESDVYLPASSVTIPKGSVCVLNIFGVHRCAAIYGPDVDEFRPERWLGDEGKELQQRCGRCGYMPFSVGKRNCIGQEYGIYETLIVSSLLFRHLRFHSVGSLPRAMFQFTLTSQDPFRVKLTLRERISQETLKEKVCVLKAASADIHSEVAQNVCMC